MADLNPGDLTEIERALLAILGSGLVPSSVANDPGFRLDYLIAVTVALLRNEAEDTYLAGETEATEGFRRELSDAFYDLAERRIIALGAAPANPLFDLESNIPRLAARDTPVNFDQHPTVFERYLAGRCLDEVLRHPAAYRFIMGKYADSSEVWQRVYKQYT